MNTAASGRTPMHVQASGRRKT